MRRIAGLLAAAAALSAMSPARSDVYDAETLIESCVDFDCDGKALVPADGDPCPPLTS